MKTYRNDDIDTANCWECSAAWRVWDDNEDRYVMAPDSDYHCCRKCERKLFLNILELREEILTKMNMSKIDLGNRFLN